MARRSTLHNKSPPNVVGTLLYSSFSDLHSLAWLQTSSHTSQMNFINVPPLQLIRMLTFGPVYPISSLCLQPLSIPSW
ncbi:hypothetical protein CFP56_005482, partial [Quercus suber]